MTALSIRTDLRPTLSAERASARRRMCGIAKSAAPAPALEGDFAQAKAHTE